MLFQPALTEGTKIKTETQQQAEEQQQKKAKVMPVSITNKICVSTYFLNIICIFYE